MVETYQKRQMLGQTTSGVVVEVAVCGSGEVIVCSGLYVVADVEVVASSGLQVQISGQHVYVESGVYVVADVEVDVSSGLHIIISGQPVTISGDHVFVESGVHVVSASGTLHTVVDIGNIRVGMATAMSTTIYMVTGASGGEQIAATNWNRESIIVQNLGAADIHTKEIALQSGEGLKIASDGSWDSDTYRGAIWAIANTSGNDACVQEESL